MTQLCGCDEKVLAILRESGETLGSLVRPIVESSLICAAVMAEMGLPAEPVVGWFQAAQDGWERIATTWPLCSEHSWCWWVAWVAYAKALRASWMEAGGESDVGLEAAA